VSSRIPQALETLTLHHVAEQRVVGSLTGDQHPKRNDYGKPVLTCRWCGHEMDYSDIYFLGPHCSVACNAAWGFYGWIFLGAVFTGILLVPEVHWGLLPHEPFITIAQSAFLWLLLVVPALVSWYCSILGYRVRRADDRPKYSSLKEYDSQIRA
jgi:hypothetical protein